ncbi:MAG: SAM-dependent methyltransferase [Deltaproteobacteria bacterium]|nr:SAM-dependent methyltransferase [Deltaproteobacteria bacterium]
MAESAHAIRSNAIGDADQEALARVGVFLDDPNRAGSYVLQDRCPLCAFSESEGLEIRPVAEALERYPWMRGNCHWPGGERWSGPIAREGDPSEPQDFFIRVRRGTRITRPFQAGLCLASENMVQRIHNIVVLEKDSELHLITGCLTGGGVKRGSHISVEELYIGERARLTHTMIQSWDSDVLVRSRSKTVVQEEGSIVSRFVSLDPAGDVRSIPRTWLQGRGASGTFSTVILGSEGSRIMTGGGFHDYPGVPGYGNRGPGEGTGCPDRRDRRTCRTQRKGIRERRRTMEIREIGRVQNGHESHADHFRMRESECRIVLHDEFEQGLYGIGEWKHLQVIFGSPSPTPYWHKCLTDCGEIRGVFATRSPIRPSGLDLATVELLGSEGKTLRVKGLNAADGSPVYDLKPFVLSIDAPHLEEERVGQLKANPRREFMQAVHTGDRVRCLVKTAEIHGHYCPGSALGVMASLWGLRDGEWESLASEGMEDLMAVVEINACFADGVQAVSGCTLGNNALIYRDLGRLAVTFAVRGREWGVRIRVRPDFRSRIDREVPEFYPLMETVIKNRAGTPEDEAAFKASGREAAFAVLQHPFEDFLIRERVRPDLPEYAPITESALCPVCGEPIMSTKTVPGGEGRGLCLVCAERPYRQVEGQGIVTRTPPGQSVSDEN